MKIDIKVTAMIEITDELLWQNMSFVFVFKEKIYYN